MSFQVVLIVVFELLAPFSDSPPTASPTCIEAVSAPTSSYILIYFPLADLVKYNG